MIAIMLLILAFITWRLGWSPADLGFDLPLSRDGAIGLVISVSVIIVFAAVNALWKRRHPEEVERAFREIESNPMLPRTPAEMRWAAAFLLAAGIGWEILYRGFLLWVLVPLIGVVGAICVAAIAYGLAHGYKSRGQLIGSVLASFAFTVAFALTGSLWWLILLHVIAGAPLVWNGRRAMRNQVSRADDGPELSV
jgi:membrane protease YdiL (CAAX protease family)